MAATQYRTDVTFGGQVLVPDGTAGAPAVAFTADTDTGIARSAANRLALVAGGTTRAIVDSSGIVLNGHLSSAADLNVTDGVSSQFRLNGAGVASITASSGVLVNSPPYATSQHAAGHIFTTAIAGSGSFSLGTAAVLGPTGNMGARAGRRYSVTLTMPDVSQSTGFPTWQVQFRIGGATFHFARFIPSSSPGTDSYQHTAFWTGAPGGGDTRIFIDLARITGTGNIQIASLGSVPAASVTIQDIGPG